MFITCTFRNWCVLHNFFIILTNFAKNPAPCLLLRRHSPPPSPKSCSASWISPSSGLEFETEPFSFLCGDLGIEPTWNKRNVEFRRIYFVSFPNDIRLTNYTVTTEKPNREAYHANQIETVNSLLVLCDSMYVPRVLWFNSLFHVVVINFIFSLLWNSLNRNDWVEFFSSSTQ